MRFIINVSIHIAKLRTQSLVTFNSQKIPAVVQDSTVAIVNKVEIEHNKPAVTIDQKNM